VEAEVSYTLDVWGLNRRTVESLDPRRGSVKVGGLFAHLLAPHWRSF
jgi:hypothetical protein